MSWVITGSEKVAQDPHLYTNTVLLLKGDGTNGSTTILDSSKVAGSPKTVTAIGNAQISTAQSKFGGASIAFDGTGDYLNIPSSVDFQFGTGNFTIETWLFTRSLSFFQVILDMRPAEGNGAYIFLALNYTPGELLYYVNTSERIITTTSAIATNTWTHIAVSRLGTSTKMFVSGVQVGVWTDSTDYLISSPRIGQSKFASFPDTFDGYIDDLRITKGVARYTANFTPPTAPFPDI